MIGQVRIMNLDTHIVVKFVNQELSADELSRLDGADIYYISDIVLWELAMLVSKKRIIFDFDAIEWKVFSRDLKILPITQEIAMQSMVLDFKADPSDHIIAATSIVHNIPLMTRDEQILKSKIVPFAK